MTLSSLDEPAMRGPYSLMIPHRQRWQKKKKKKWARWKVSRAVKSNKLSRRVASSCRHVAFRERFLKRRTQSGRFCEAKLGSQWRRQTVLAAAFNGPLPQLRRWSRNVDAPRSNPVSSSLFPVSERVVPRSNKHAMSVVFPRIATRLTGAALHDTHTERENKHLL